MNGVEAYYPDGDVFFDLFQRGNLDRAEGNTEALWTLQNDVNVWHDFVGNHFLPYAGSFSPVMREMRWKSMRKPMRDTGLGTRILTRKCIPVVIFALTWEDGEYPLMPRPSI